MTTDYWRDWRAAMTVKDRLHRVIEQRDDLRAVVAPLLDGLWLIGDDVGAWCLFCEAPAPIGVDCAHKPGCPVLRRAELLGEG